MDEDLLEDGPALAAELARERPAVEPGVDRRALQLVAGRRREPPAGPLELGLDRLEDVDDVGAGARLELELGRA